MQFPHSYFFQKTTIIDVHALSMGCERCVRAAAMAVLGRNWWYVLLLKYISSIIPIWYTARNINYKVSGHILEKYLIFTIDKFKK